MSGESISPFTAATSASPIPLHHRPKSVRSPILRPDRNSRIPTRRLDQRVSRLYPPALLGLLNHPQRNAVLHAAPRIEHLQLGIHRRLDAQALRDLVQPHEWRVPDLLRNGVHDGGRDCGTGSGSHGGGCTLKPLLVLGTAWRIMVSGDEERIGASRVVRGARCEARNEQVVVVWWSEKLLG